MLYDDSISGDIAQLVEHLVRNQRVVGSNPIISTFINRLNPAVLFFNTIFPRRTMPVFHGTLDLPGAFSV